MNDLNLLKVFEAIMSTGSVNEAANKLNVTPPAISQSLNKLRDKYKEPLFVKSGRGLKATSFAEELYSKIKEPLAVLINSSSINTDFDPLTSDRTFKIGTNPDIDLLVYSRLLNKVKELAPNVKLEVVAENNSSEENTQNILRLRKVDLILTTIPLEEKSYNNKIVSEEDMVLLARKGHPDIVDGSISFEDFFKQEHTALSLTRNATTTVNSLAKDNLPNRKISYTSHSILNLIFTTAKTDLLTVATKNYYNLIEDLNIVEMLEPPFPCHKLPIYMTWHRTFDKDIGLNWLRNVINDSFKND